MANRATIDPSKLTLIRATSAIPAPATYWLTATDTLAGFTVIVVPSAGNLWVFYECSFGPLADIYVSHYDGSTTPINPGVNNVTVGDGDAIIYGLTGPGTDFIKIAYRMT